MMEMNRRRSKGFMISKLMPFCKAIKPLPSSEDLYNNYHYTTTTPLPTTTSYAPQTDFNNYVTTTTTPLPPKVSFFLEPYVLDTKGKDMEKKINIMAEKLIGRGLNGVDECVDARAASYISSVRERFKMDHGDQETDDCY